jgi:hypothetical protein
LIRIPFGLKLAYTAFLTLWIPYYWAWYGPQNFLWFCDIANFVLAVAVWRESRLLFSWQAVSVLAVQILWTVDLAGRALTGFHWIGGAEYMFDDSVPGMVRLLSLFHAGAAALMIWALARFGYDRRALRLQLATCWAVLPICFFFFGPDLNLNWVWGPFDRPQTAVAPGLYFAACMVGYPLALYVPSHLALSWGFRGGRQSQR